MHRMLATEPSSIILRAENIQNIPLIFSHKYEIFLKLNKYQRRTVILKFWDFREAA